MKLKSLILGSVAAAGLSTAGFAADLGVLTSLDVCDALGISGLTISSADNCLAISGGVSYEFGFGEFRQEGVVAATIDPRQVAIGGSGEDWDSRVISWLKAVGTASSDFGPASATITLKSDYRYRTTQNAAGVTVQTIAENGNFFADEAFVQVGDTTTIMAGKKGSIANLGDDAPFNYLGLFNSASLDGAGVGIDADTDYLGGHVIQVVSSLGNGVSVGVGMEALNIGDVVGTNVAESAGTLVGVVSYAGEGLTAHLTGAAFEVLSGDVESWLIHAGVTGTFDAFRVRAAASYFNNSLIGTPAYRGADVLNALVSAEGTFDLFKIALSGEIQNVTDRVGGGADFTDYGLGGSVGATVTEGVSINLGARYFHEGLNDLGTTQIAAQVVAALTETIKATGELGGYFGSKIEAQNTAGVFQNDTIIYGAAQLDWAPGGGFTSSLRGELNSEDAYKVTFKAAKEFK